MNSILPFLAKTELKQVSASSSGTTKTFLIMILCLFSLQTIMGFNTQAVTPELNSENNTDQLVLNTPAFGNDIVNLHSVNFLRLSWQWPSNLPDEMKTDILLELSANPSFSSPTWTLFPANGADEMMVVAEHLNKFLFDNDPQASDYPSITVYARCTSNDYVSNVIEMNVKVYSTKYDPMPQPWYFVGEGIGINDWDNRVLALGASMFPMNILDDGNSRFTGYFNSGERFKLVGVPGQWDIQISSYDGGPYNLIYGDYGGDNINIYEDGWYTFEVNMKNKTASGKKVDDVEWFPVREIFINSDKYGSNFISMNACDATNGYNHVWYARVTFDNDDFVQFSYNRDNSEILMGATGFPFEFAVNGNQKIPVKAGSYVVFFDHLTGYYQFNDASTGLLAEPLSTDNDTAVLPVSSLPTISLANITTETVKVCDFTLPQEAEIISIKLQVANQVFLSMNANGEVNTETLKNTVASLYGQYGRHDMGSVVTMEYLQRDLVRLLSSDPFVVSVKMPSLPVEEHYYYIGNKTEWNFNDNSMPMTCLSGDQWASDPRFSIDIPLQKGQEDWFAIFPASAQTSDNFWSCVVRPNDSEAMSGTIDICDSGIAWHLKAPEQDCIYRLTLDFNEATFELIMISTKPVEEHYYYIGNLTGWDSNNTSMPMTCLSGDLWASDPRFYIDIPLQGGQEEWFAIFPASAQTSSDFWYNIIRPSDSEAMSGNFTDLGYGNSWHIPASDQDCIYRLTLDFNQRTYIITMVSPVATAITSAQADRKNAPASYDLQGRRISSATPLKKGIYIFDGKKVVVK